MPLDRPPSGTDAPPAQIPPVGPDSQTSALEAKLRRLDETAPPSEVAADPREHYGSPQRSTERPHGESKPDLPDQAATRSRESADSADRPTAPVRPMPAPPAEHKIALLDAAANHSRPAVLEDRAVTIHPSDRPDSPSTDAPQNRPDRHDGAEPLARGSGGAAPTESEMPRREKNVTDLVPEGAVQSDPQVSGRERLPLKDGAMSTPPDTMTRAEDDRPVRSPEDLEPRLAEIYESSIPSTSGRAFYSEDDSWLRSQVLVVKQIDGVYSADLHGSPDHFSVGDTRLDGRELSDLIRADSEWAGRPVRLLSCETGRGENPVAQEVADSLGVVVTAPTDLVGNHRNGELFLVAETLDEYGNIKRVVPENARWIDFYPRNEGEH